MTTTMAHVQGQQRRDVTNPQPPPCHRLRPRGRQRHQQQHVQWLLSLLTVFQLLGIAIGGQVIGGGNSSSISSSSSSSTQSPVKDNTAAVNPTWRRMGLSESVTNNERELINKILRDDSPSAATSFPYALPPAGTSLLPATVADAAAAATESGAVVPVNGKINQSRSKEEQEAFNKQLHLETRRRRRAVNVVVNTIFTSSERRRRRSSSSSELENSNFLLKSIVTDIDKYCGGRVKKEYEERRNKCTRDKLHRRLTTEDIPQMMKNSSQQDFANVTALDLSDSGLRSLPRRSIDAIVAKLPNIEFLDLSLNQLRAANLTLSGRVTFLNFSQNQLKRFQLQSSRRGSGTSSSNTTLAYLDLSSNNLTGAVGKEVLLLGPDCANLTMLDVSHNHLVDLMFLRQRSRSTAEATEEDKEETTRPFRVLNFAYNRLQSIKRDTFSGTPHLEILSLAHNLVAEIENDTFASLQHLQYLDLSGNLLNASSIRALQGIPDLIGLSLARNPQLGDALQGFVASWSLKELDISATGLCEIPAALAQSVRTLNLAHNHFQMIRCGDLDSYPLLYNLDLGHCNIAEIEDDALGRLEMLATLNLNHNDLRQVPISLPVNLIALHLERNKIMELQANRFAHLTALKVLSLSGNKIQYLPALPLRKLVVLNLVSAELHGLSQLVVQTSPHLKDLRLDNNPVKCADLLGIAEWATPCRDVGGTDESQSAFTDYHDLDDEELLELSEENDKNQLKFLLDYVASKGAGESSGGERSRQLLSTSFDKEHYCRSAGAGAEITTPHPTLLSAHLNATKSAQVTPVQTSPLERAEPAATLARNKSFRADAARETDTGETEQISSNLPNPRFQQTVTVLPAPTIIKTLPSRSRLSTADSLPPYSSSSSSSSSSAAKNNGQPEAANLPMRQNNGSLQITDHLNSNKRNDRVDDVSAAAAATNVNAEEEATHSANEILATDTSAKSLSSAHLSRTNEAAAASTTRSVGKSSESVAIKLANNKSANRANSDNSHDFSPVTTSTVVVDVAVGAAGDNKKRKQVNRVNNKKLIKLTDSSKNRKLMPFIGETGQRRKISTDTGAVMFVQQSESSTSSSSSNFTTTTPPIKVTIPQPEKIIKIENKTTSMLVTTTTTTENPMTTTYTKPVTDPSPTWTISTDTQTMITMSPAAAAAARPEKTVEKSLPISSKQIIFQRKKIAALTQDEVHNNLALSADENSTATVSATAVVVSKEEEEVNESVEMKKNLPKTVPAKPMELRNDSKVVGGDSKQVANDKIMSEARATTTTTTTIGQSETPPKTKGLIEETSLDDSPAEEDDDDDDNPLLKLWQQSSTHLSHKTTTTKATVEIIAKLPGANPDALPATPPTTSAGGGDVNEGKNLIRTKSESDNKNVTITRLPGASLKSETILINDRNNDDKDKDDNSAGGGGTGTGTGTYEDSVLKLNPQQAKTKNENKDDEDENGKIYVAENSLSVAELVVVQSPTYTTTASRDGRPSNSQKTDSPQNANNNNNNPRGDTNRRPDKLSQLNTNSIHVAKAEKGEQDEVQELIEGSDVNVAASVEVGGNRQPWKEHIKDDGRRNGNDHQQSHGAGIGGDDNDHDDNGADDANSDNYHHRQPHPGLFIVIGASFGIVLSIGLFRCKRSGGWRQPGHYPLPDTGRVCGGSHINQTYTQQQRHHRHMNQNSDDNDEEEERWWCGRTTTVAAEEVDDQHGEAIVDNFRARQRFLGQNDSSSSGVVAVDNDDHYRCTNWRNRVVVADKDKCDGSFVDVQLTPKSERKSVKFDLLPMKVLSPNDLHQPDLFHPIMTSDCDYTDEHSQRNNNGSKSWTNGSSKKGNNCGCDMGTGSVLDRSNKSSPLDRW